MIFGIAAMALDLILGYGALVSFGHAAFLGIGGYAVGILASHGIEDLLVQIPVALAASAAFALVTGAISLRTQGRLFHHDHPRLRADAVLSRHIAGAYGGDDGMTLSRAASSPGTDILKNDFAFYWACLLCLFGAYVFSAIDRRLPLRPGSARHAGERRPHGSHRLPALPLPARRLCDQRHDGGACRMPAGQPGGVRQPRLS